MVETLSETAFAKINLALHVRRRREDGYHELETLFAFVDSGDSLACRPDEGLSLTIDGPFADELDNGPDNLVLRAARALGEANNIVPAMAFRLEKRLPVAAGLGGGSADAAAALRLLAEYWGLGPDQVRPMDVAASLGADVPACVLSRTMRGEGVGDRLVAVEADALSGLAVLLANPCIACPTGPVFAHWDGVDRGPLNDADFMNARNDLAAPAMALHPVIGDVIAALEACKQVRLVRMSGSGATCFALFDYLGQAEAAAQAIVARYPNWWTMTGRLR